MKRGRRLIVIGISAFLTCIGGWTLYHYEVLPAGLRLQCIIFQTTGLNCPGCGATRACYAILHGDWIAALGYNPMLVLLLPFLGIYIAVRSMDWAITGGNHIDRHIPDKFLYILFVVIIVYGIVRNIPVWPFYLLHS